jgi:hypothetical protein
LLKINRNQLTAQVENSTKGNQAELPEPFAHLESLSIQALL